MLTADQIRDFDDAQIIRLEDERRKRRPLKAAELDARHAWDAWVHLWTIPAQMWLSFCRGVHENLRPGR